MKNIHMKKILLSLSALLVLPLFAETDFIRVSKENPRYFETNGKCWIPNGYNLAFPRPFFYDKSDDEAFELIEKQISALAANGGNYIRIWTSAGFYEFETAAGVFDEKKLARLDRLMALAEKYGIRVKLCLEHFRNVKEYTPVDAERGLPVDMFSKSIYSGDFKNMIEYLESEKGKIFYLARAKKLADRYRDNPYVFGIELWNEGDTVSVWPRVGLMEKWTAEMLPRVKKLFPNHMIMQSLGSFSEYYMYGRCYEYANIAGNDVAQVHRYLDLGATMDICKGPIDIFASDSVRVLREMSKTKPVVLAETGAVKPNHSGPSELYEKDTEGSILHDILFAPFYSGAAGAGQCWHWEKYILGNNLYWQFGRFAKAVEGLNPIAENFEPFRADTKTLRVYGLNGKNTLTAWIRDSSSDWRSEIERGEKPKTVSSAELDFARFIGSRKAAKAQVYNPWTDKSVEVELKNGKLRLPDFRKSVVVKIKFGE